MVDVLLVLLTVLVVWVALVVGLGWVALRRARRSNRVTPAVPSPAPLWWRWSPSGPATLHRRLQAAAFAVDPARPDTGLVPSVGTDELRADVVTAALHTDATLAALRRAPARVRRIERTHAAQRVAAIEQVCARLHERPAPLPPVRALVARNAPPPDGDLVALLERVQHLEAGRAEVRRWSAEVPVRS
jgi:hypothetical protein